MSPESSRRVSSFTVMPLPVSLSVGPTTATSESVVTERVLTSFFASQVEVTVASSVVKSRGSLP